MLKNNIAADLARIGLGAIQKPTVIERGGDLGQAIANGIGTWNKFHDKQAYIDALQGGDQGQIDKALAAYDPQAYAKVMETRQARENAIADADRKFEQEKELARIKHGYDMGLAQWKAQNGIGSNGLVNINMNPLDKKRIETIGKKMDENIASSQEMVDKYSRMEQLLNSPNVTTGGLKGYAQEQLNDAFLNPETVELRSLIKEIVPRMRPTGSGSTSDRDMKIFEEATVGLAKDKDANLNIVKGRKMVDENNIAKEELRYQWLSNGGGLGEFDKQWRDYLNKNPIFENKAGKLNPNRKDAYEWFYGTTTPSNATVQIKAPDGRIFEIPESEVENAIAQGGVRL